MNRRGLWVGGVALILLVVAAGALTTVGAGYAKDENASRAKCSKDTLDGTYLFAFNGVQIKGNNQVPFAFAGYAVLTATVRRKASLPLTLTGRLLVMNPSLQRIPSRRIAQAPSPIGMVRRSICSSPPMAVCLRSSRPSPPNLWGRGLNRAGRPSV